jgi:RHS repeat-associated protein
VTRIERDGRPTLDLTWNGQYQLVSVSTNGAFAEGYAYDALGRRISTTTLEGTVRHVYDDSWQCLADIDENGNVLRSYVWGEGIDNLLAVKIGDESYYPITDIQGTVWGYADSANNVVARWTYDAWGNVLSEEVSAPAPASVRYRFQGREWSAVTGLINFRMRWYDANVGRWLSKDSAGLKGGINLFVLCRNDPVNFFDADGCGVLGLFAKTAKMTWKLISRTHAEKMLKKHQTVTMIGKWCGKKAKRLVESATGKKTVRHDGHGPCQAPHYQPKNGGGAHVRVPGAHITEGMGFLVMP